MGIVFETLRSVVGLPPLPPGIPEADRPLFREAHRLARRVFGPAAWGPFPPGVHRFDAHLYAGMLVLLRDVYLPDTPVLTRAEREIVAVSVSVSNECYYCTHNHSGVTRALAGKGLDELIRTGRFDEIEDARVADLARFGQTLDASQSPTLSREEIQEASLVAFVFHYTNRLMDALGPTEKAKQLLAHPPDRAIAWLLKAKRSLQPAALDELRSTGRAPLVEIDEEEAVLFQAVCRDEARARALAFMASCVRHAAREAFDAKLLDAVREDLERWDGSRAPLIATWLDVAKLEPRHQRLAKQMLMVARAPYRIVQAELLEAVDGDQRKQLILTSYAAFEAAQQLLRLATATPGARRAEL